jgi:hypothetical protein
MNLWIPQKGDSFLSQLNDYRIFKDCSMELVKAFRRYNEDFLSDTEMF